MPILDMPLDTWTEWPKAILQIMIDPRLEHPGDLAHSINMATVQRAAKRLGASHPIVKEYFTEILIEAYEAPKPKEILAESLYEHRAANTWRGFMSGTIFLHALSRASAGDARVSIKSTVEQIAEACQNRLKGAQERELVRTWSQFSSVSHLWATMKLSENGWFKTGEWGKVAQSQKRLLTWLSYAQVLYSNGIACKLWRSKGRSTLLDPTQTWSLLPTEGLPDVSFQIPSTELIISSLSKVD